MTFPSSPPPFTIAEDDTAQPVIPSSPYHPTDQEGGSLTPSSWANNPNGLVSRLARLKLDSSSSISRSRIVAVANEDEGVRMRGDGKPLDFLLSGLSIEQAPDKPSFTIGSDKIAIQGYYSPDGDDIIIHSCGEGGLEIALYSSVTDEMASSRMVETPVSLNVGLWQISKLGQPQFYICIFPRTYTFHLNSNASKRSRSEHEENKHRPQKRIRLAQIERKQPAVRTPKSRERATRTDPITEASAVQLSKTPSRMSRPEMHASLVIGAISVTGRRTTREIFKLNSVELVQRQSSSTRVLIGQHAQYGLVSVKMVVHSTRHSIRQLAQRWCREVSVAKETRHLFLTRVLSADARLLSICLDGQPILLRQKDHKNYFNGTFEESIRLCIQIASALVFLHSKLRKPHLAVNSSNILKRGDSFSLSGFGITEDITGSNITRDEMQWYAAPEHIFGESATPLGVGDSREYSCEDGKKDVFSFAIILAYAWKYIPLPEICGGSMPSSRAQWLRNIERIRRANRDRLPDSQTNILLRSLDPEPETRCSSQGLLELALDGFKESAEEILRASVAEAITRALT